MIYAHGSLPKIFSITSDIRLALHQRFCKFSDDQKMMKHYKDHRHSENWTEPGALSNLTQEQGVFRIYTCIFIRNCS